MVQKFLLCLINKGQLWHSVLHLTRINTIYMEDLSLFPKIGQASKPWSQDVVVCGFENLKITVLDKSYHQFVRNNRKTFTWYPVLEREVAWLDDRKTTTDDAVKNRTCFNHKQQPANVRDKIEFNTDWIELFWIFANFTPETFTARHKQTSYLVTSLTDKSGQFSLMKLYLPQILGLVAWNSTQERNWNFLADNV